jgi:hypothetical protein
MSKITIIPIDGVTGVDGVFHQIDLTDIGADIHAIQFDDVSGSGHIEFNDGKKNQSIGKAAFKPFEKYVNRWKAANTPPERTLEQAKLDARQQINGKRDTLEASGFPYLDKTFDSDPRSVQRISTAVQAAQAAIGAGQPFSITWTAQDNTTVDLDAVGMMGMPVALAQYAAGLHEHAKGKKALIDAATTITEVDAIQW